jgi:hypothetical protein
MYRKSLARANARKTITRDAHGAVLALHSDGVPKNNADWHYDLRRGRLCIYGGLLRFIDECIAKGRPELARQSVAWLDWYVVETSNPTDTAEIKLVA